MGDCPKASESQKKNGVIGCFIPLISYLFWHSFKSRRTVLQFKCCVLLDIIVVQCSSVFASYEAPSEQHRVSARRESDGGSRISG